MGTLTSERYQFINEMELLEFYRKNDAQITALRFGFENVSELNRYLNKHGLKKQEISLFKNIIREILNEGLTNREFMSRIELYQDKERRISLLFFKIVEKFRKGNVKAHDIKRELSVCKDTVYKLIKQLNISKYHQNDDWLIEMYFEKGLSQKQIAFNAGCSLTTIERRFSELKQKNPLLKMRFAKRKINEDFFVNLNEKGAYILGFIIADGCIYIQDSSTCSIQIGVQICDKDILEKIKKAMGSEHNIEYYSYKSKKNGKVYESYRLRIGSKKMVDDLMRIYRVLPRKSCNEIFPIIPQEFYPHLIRGILDGDGCLYVNEKGKLRVIFYGGKSLLKGIESKLQTSLSLTEKEVHEINSWDKELEEIFIDSGKSREEAREFMKKKKRGHLYQLSYSANNEVNKILNWIYGNENPISLNRKDKIAKNYLESLVNSNKKENDLMTEQESREIGFIFADDIDSETAYTSEIQCEER